jgi:type I restriction enzyme R subunit
MLLTGFDAPIEQVLYLDKVIIAHNLLQAIARVNRVGGSGKDKGFVVDYVGIGHHLKKAIDNYDEREQKEVLAVLSFPEQELRDLEASHAKIIQFLKQYGLTLESDLDAFYDLFYDEDIRFDYMQAFRQFTRCLNVLYPAKEALAYLADYEVLTAINARAAMHFRDGRISMKDIPPKLRVIADVYLQSQGINVKVQPISILDENFEQEVGKRKRTKTKAAEIAHAIRHYLTVDLTDDPDLQASFAAALSQIFEQFQNNWNKIYEELEKLRERIRNASQEPTYGLHRQKQMPFFRCLKREIYGEDPPNQTSTTGDAKGTTQAAKAGKKVSEPTGHYTTAKEEDQIAILVDLTQQIYLTVERELKLTGFWESIPARNKLKAELQQVLLAPRFTLLPQLIKHRAHIISRIMEIAEAKNDTILYAE